MMSEEEVKHLLREVELEIEREPHQTGKLYYKGARRALRMVLKLEGELTHGT